MSSRSFDAPLITAGTRCSVLVVGGQFAGTFCARELKREFDVTLVDAKEFFEFTPGILRAYVQPNHFDSLSFSLAPVMSKIGVRFIAGEVKQLDYDGQQVLADIKALHDGDVMRLKFDYCIVCAGCCFGPFSKWGESLWFPTIHEAAREESEWRDIDERFLEGRRRHILQDFDSLTELNARSASILVVGAGFIGVEWVTELQYYFRNLNLNIVDVLPNCLGPLPPSAAAYCARYMTSVGIKQHYRTKYDPNSMDFWQTIGIPEKADRTFVCIGVKAANYFMPPDTLSVTGPGGGGWILFNQKLQVTTRPPRGAQVGDVWAGGRVFAVGDCNYGCIGNPPDWVMPPVPKVSFPSEEQANHACRNVRLMNAEKALRDTYWPWGAGLFATSLGPRDACFVMGASYRKGSGYLVNWWLPAVWQKDIIERTYVAQERGHWTNGVALRAPSSFPELEGARQGSRTTFLRRALLSLGTSAALFSTQCPSSADRAYTPAPVGYRSIQLRIGQKQVPTSVWYPAQNKPYQHFISVGKIVEVLQGALLPRSVGWEFDLQAGLPIFADASPLAPETSAASETPTRLQQLRSSGGLLPKNCAVIFAHGYLGSRFDMLHLCERLASQGFVVAAPDFSEGLSGAVSELPRRDIVSELLAKLRRAWGAQQFGIVGHSAGGGTATVSPGPFACGRVAVAGLAPGYADQDPLLVLASEGDGVVRLERVLQAIPSGIPCVEDPGNYDLSKKSGAVLLRRGLKDGQQAPCHISFLSAETNKAMISLLSPLLPVARVLEVPVLDFDTYLELQDSEEVAAATLPLIEDFFCKNAAKQ
eukprot:s1516_g4.t1